MHYKCTSFNKYIRGRFSIRQLTSEVLAGNTLGILRFDSEKLSSIMYYRRQTGEQTILLKIKQTRNFYIKCIQNQRTREKGVSITPSKFKHI